jgi:two-component system, NtrC family, response regulator AtoC
MAHILIIEDDPLFAKMLQHKLRMDPDYRVTTCSTGQEALKQLSQSPSAITLDINLPDVNGLTLLKEIKKRLPQTPVLVISGQDDLNVAIQIFREGAFDYIYKDDHVMERLWHSIHNATKQIELTEELEILRNEVSEKYNISRELKGSSQEMNKVFSLVEKTLHSSINVLITGETGTGKELVARAIHFNSKRKHKPFVAVNVAAIPRELIESELFGYEKGAFTGAQQLRIGLLEEAKGGTLFLDEIGEMELPMQAKLLRVLQEMEVTRLGSNKKTPLEFRLVVATHKNLRNEVKAGNFREDLFYRLLGVTIELPPLRNRGKDILFLAYYFIQQFCSSNKIEKKELSNDAKKLLMQYPFPGNVRELKAMVETGIVMSDTQIIQPEDIPTSNHFELKPVIQEGKTLEDYSLEIISNYLKSNNNNVVETAKKLGIGKSTIYRFIKEGKLLTNS